MCGLRHALRFTVYVSRTRSGGRVSPPREANNTHSSWWSRYEVEESLHCALHAATIYANTPGRVDTIFLTRSVVMSALQQSRNQLLKWQQRKVCMCASLLFTSSRARGLHLEHLAKKRSTAGSAHLRKHRLSVSALKVNLLTPSY